jgi:hypothetical protein
MTYLLFNRCNLTFIGKMCGIRQTRHNDLHPIVISGIANFIRGKQTNPSEEKYVVDATNQ